MKSIRLIASLFTLSLLLGCKPSAEKSASETTPTTNQPLANAQLAAKDAATPIKEYNFGQKTEFIMAMREQLAALKQSMDELSAKIEKSSEAVKAEAAPKFAVLREQATQLNKQLDEISEATLSTWDVMKAETEKSYDKLKDGIAQSRQAVSDKIAP